jgi:hypothetical protein
VLNFDECIGVSKLVLSGHFRECKAQVLDSVISFADLCVHELFLFKDQQMHARIFCEKE